MTKNQWQAQNDENPLLHGGFWVKQDEDDVSSFYVYRWIPCDDEESFGYLLDGYVTPTDSWIDGEAIKKYQGFDYDVPIEDMVRAVFDYYSPENFG
jgi:hypothetical protein